VRVESRNKMVQVQI